MISITADLLVAAVGCTRELAERYATHLAAACAAYRIDTPARVAAFLAQLGHESGAFKYVREIASGDAYEGRASLGNTQPGDGRRFKGRGLIQTTGRSNYERTTFWLQAQALGNPDFVDQPEALEQPIWAAWASAAYWHHNKLNALADAGEFVKIGRAINRGNPNAKLPANGEADRIKRWERAKQALSATPQPQQEQVDMPAPLLVAAMSPFISAAASAIADAVPKLGELFAGESPTAKRNVQAAVVAVEAVKSALGAANEQEVVEQLQVGGPEVVATVTKAVEDNWYALHEASEKSIAQARAFAVSYAQNKDVRTVAWGLTFIEMLSLIMVLSSLAGGVLMVLFGGLDDQLKGAIVMLMLIGGYTGVKEFWFGSSHGSKTKDDTSGSRPG